MPTEAVCHRPGFIRASHSIVQVAMAIEKNKDIGLDLCLYYLYWNGMNSCGQQKHWIGMVTMYRTNFFQTIGKSWSRPAWNGICEDRHEDCLRKQDRSEEREGFDDHEVCPDCVEQSEGVSNWVDGLMELHN